MTLFYNHVIETIVLEDAPIDKEKRSKALKKKLKQVEEIKAKVAEGRDIDQDQVSSTSLYASVINVYILAKKVGK